MSLHYTLTDDAYNAIAQDLRYIKAIAGVLSTASSFADVEGDELCSLAFLIHHKTVDIEKVFEASPPLKSEEAPAQEPPTETDPLERGKSVIAYFKLTYDFLNSAIAREPRIKEQLKGLQGEAADLMAKFDDLLIDLDCIPGEAPGPAA
jgi:hypothetical protein